jgi:hypothetical protein
MLGYIVQIWSQLKHRAWAGQRYPKANITGTYVFDAAELADQGDGKEWRVSSVLISIDAYPKSGNTIFSAPNIIQAGYFAWHRSTVAQDGLDWTIAPDAGGSGFQSFGQIGVDLQFPFLLGPPRTFNETGVVDLATTGGEPTTGGTAGPGVWDTQLHAQPASFEVGIQSFGGTAPNKPSKSIAGGVVQNIQEKWHYPLQWLNWVKMWFEAPDPNVNGFTIKLKPGVVASINVGLTVRDPQVSYGGGEAPGAAFNPMKGGAI